jgi:hypothetical protein
MPANRNINPRTPGTQDESDKMPPQQGEENTPEAPETDEEITIKKSELEEMVAGMVESRVVSEVKAARRRVELAKNPMEAEDLPDQKDVDATKLKRAVLTKQGWVCPLVHPSDKNRANKTI